ncbi:ubiquinol-cytochrome c reductase iron-sulfur subunit [Candidatus Endobugula sertula]|uniref:Ubiquinol-cytochrome c reductase iron-sulfur subunit n=1 Tax=Candidatus Endobugula sertula TaxID=62101 RepID=A0A1D2QTT0_9GAMM|nr:ubiquinol-cytochrome c reductase iron-sulfur subunit [Candidatus Endobugula sertula]
MSDGEVVNQGRRRFLTAATSVVGGAGAVAVAVPFVGSWNPSAKAKAAGAPILINLAKIGPGQMVTEEWRGKPVYIIRRTEEALAGLKKVEEDASIRDPASTKSVQPEYAKNETRSRNPEFMIMLGVCTHLGCAPKFRPDVGAQDLGGDSWQGGFFCPCHGSRFDLAGRVYKGVPAPINLEIPPHFYKTDTVVVIGEDGGVAS